MKKKMKLNIKSILPKIPKGLGDQILQKKFGKDRRKLTDLLLRKFSIETVLMMEKPHKIIKDALEKELREVFSEIEAITDHLRLWYVAYTNMCANCGKCEFNHKNQYCKYYGNKKLPTPDPDKPNKICPHCTAKHAEKMHINN
jgi:hypothetical protein